MRPFFKDEQGRIGVILSTTDVQTTVVYEDYWTDNNGSYDFESPTHQYDIIDITNCYCDINLSQVRAAQLKF